METTPGLLHMRGGTGGLVQRMQENQFRQREDEWGNHHIGMGLCIVTLSFLTGIASLARAPTTGGAEW